MDYKQLKCFIKLCETNNFSHAAQQLFMSQQALSKMISKLEEELSVPLFVRQHNGLQLTKYGKTLLTRSFLYTKYHEDTLNIINNMQSENEICFSLGYPVGMSIQFPPNFFSTFINENPNIHFLLKGYADDKYNRSLKNHDFDMVFCSMINDLHEINIHYHYKHKLFAIMSKDHPLAKLNNLQLSDLRSQFVITLNTENTNSDSVNEMCKKNNIIPSVYVSPSEQSLINELLINNNAISFYGGRTNDLPQHIISKKIIDLDLYWEFYIITRQDYQLSPLAIDLINYTKRALEEI